MLPGSSAIKSTSLSCSVVPSALNVKPSTFCTKPPESPPNSRFSLNVRLIPFPARSTFALNIWGPEVSANSICVFPFESAGVPWLFVNGVAFVPSVKVIANDIGPVSPLSTVYIITTVKPSVVLPVTGGVVIVPLVEPVPTITAGAGSDETLQPVASVAVNSSLTL